ncbi:hypothetical protein PBY51_014513 [Eleginops maclovinus]|uniref:Uncharacterized protein n=1 Tax=Eleginops maclovinus TaxID=56733 RepID=A0AAN7WVW2_ELEMC|nr:hypothetical protein PBY51_014513 [Eleginops maclovinus]
MNPGRISGDAFCSAAAAFLAEGPGEADSTQFITLSSSWETQEEIGASLHSHKSDETPVFPSSSSCHAANLERGGFLCEGVKVLDH